MPTAEAVAKTEPAAPQADRENTRDEIPLYAKHPGTVTISGKTEVGKAARYIVHLFEQGTVPLEVLFIGANSGQQAYKSCSVARNIAHEELGVHFAFVPKRVRTMTHKRDVVGEVVKDEAGNPVDEVKDAGIWQVLDATGLLR